MEEQCYKNCNTDVAVCHICQDWEPGAHKKCTSVSGAEADVINRVAFYYF
jgi:hypothetical protein